MGKDKENPSHAVNLICEGTLISGDVKTPNDIRIDGSIKGRVITAGRVVIGHTGIVEGDIDCTSIDVQGTVAGNILASGQVALKASARIQGNITSSALSVETGVVFNGLSRMQAGK